MCRTLGVPNAIPHPSCGPSYGHSAQCKRNWVCQSGCGEPPPPLLASLRGNERNLSANFAERVAPLIPGRASGAKPIPAQGRASGFRAQRIAGAKPAAPSVLRFLHARARNPRERRCVTFRRETEWSCRAAAGATHWARADADAGAATRCRLAVGLKPLPILGCEVIALVSASPSTVRAVLRSGRSGALL
jgi:hypothetical protein